jgi:hypothetical protein
MITFQHSGRRKSLNYTKLLSCFGMLLLAASVLVACGRDGEPESTATMSPLSPMAVPPTRSAGSPETALETGQVYAARFHGAWASGYPYPVFFIDAPPGTTQVVLEQVVYASEEPLSGVHPRLEKVLEEIVWPSGATSQVVADEFYYDAAEGTLLTYNATLDGASLDTVAYDISSADGVGISYLGDTGGVNVFFNCSITTSMDYQELGVNEQGKPTQAVFSWECEGRNYTIEVETAWGKSDPDHNIDVIEKLTATITRE